MRSQPKRKKKRLSSKTGPARSASQLSKDHRYHRTLKGQYSTVKAHAREKGILFSITMEEFAELRSLPCFYECGRPLSEASGSLDRMDPKGPYSVDNVVPCCKRCNISKGDWWTWREMLAASRAVNRMRKRFAARKRR